MQMNAVPATPVVTDMIGATIRCTFYKPWQRPNIEKVGVITKLMTYKNVTYLWVVADDGKQKWVSEFDFIEYVRETKTAAEAAAVA